MSAESFELDKAVVRMKRIMIALGVLGTVVFSIVRGAPWAVGYAIGAAIAVVSFEFTHRFVKAIGPGGEAKPKTWKSVLVGTRYLLIGAVVYVMMIIFGFNILAALLGLLTAAAAALIEVLYEFIHGT